MSPEYSIVLISEVGSDPLPSWSYQINNLIEYKQHRLMLDKADRFKFNPDTAGANAASRCNTVEIIS